MGDQAGLPHYSLQEYLTLEEMSNVRHEYLDGHIYAMAGGTPEHGRVCANLIALLANRLEGRPCTVFTSDVRIRVAASGLDTYPDVSVVCGPTERDPLDRNALTNPTLLFEVTSDSTERYDRGDKLEHYKRIPSLREIVVVSHGGTTIDVWRRDGRPGWAQQTFASGEAVTLSSLDCELPFEAVFRDPLAG